MCNLFQSRNWAEDTIQLQKWVIPYGKRRVTQSPRVKPEAMETLPGP